MSKGCIFFGFDSAWANKDPGAICAFGVDSNGKPSFLSPRPVNFTQALQFINTHKADYAFSLIALDQPTIVPNVTGNRPVESVAGAVIGYVGGGVQSSNTGAKKANLFGPNAPIWDFKSNLSAKDDPFQAKSAQHGTFLIEVYPALALTGWHDPFAAHDGAPKYNPKKKNFRIEDWRSVCNCVAAVVSQAGLPDVSAWVGNAGGIARPSKADQDGLDAVICALIGLLWKSGPAGDMRCIGDVTNGYMVTPVSVVTDTRLRSAASKNGVPYSDGSLLACSKPFGGTRLIHIVEFGTTQSFKEACAEYEKACGLLDSESEPGIDTARAAEQLLISAALKGNPYAMHDLGVIYAHGLHGLEKDLAKAFDWYLVAAQIGYSGAQNNLAYMYETGEGAPQSYADAVLWYTHAAMAGQPTAYLGLGTCYLNGWGLRQSNVEAYFWLSLAVAALPDGRNMAKARERLERCQSSLAPLDKREVEIRLRLFRPLKQTAAILADDPG